MGRQKKVSASANPIGVGYTSEIYKSLAVLRKRIMVGIPMTGLVRSEWVLARYSQVTPCNWSQVECYHWVNQYTPLDFLVADARNIIVAKCLENDYEWLFFIDSDVILPPDTVLKMNERMLDAKIPVWSGLYFTKSVPAEPLIYRGRGTGYFKKWKLGDKVWVDGIPMGCTMIHSSILKAMWNECEEYYLRDSAGKECKVRRVYNTPAMVWYDPEKLSWFTQTGTEDLDWCSRVMAMDIFRKAGWKDYAKKKYPFLLDTSIFCKHIDPDGIQYPTRGEHMEFMNGR